MQNKVREFNSNRSCHLKPMPVAGRLLDIESELGELGKEYLKCSKYGTAEFVKNEDFELEFGDVLYSLLSLADEAGIDSNEALDKVLKKYQDRISKNNSMGSGN